MTRLEAWLTVELRKPIRPWLATLGCAATAACLLGAAMIGYPS